MQTFKKTIRTIILFVLAFTVLSTILFEIFFRSEIHVYQDIRERAALAGSIDTLISGASYAKRALIPAEMDKVLGTNTYNLSASEMTMQGRYQLLFEEFARNPVKTVYLELSMHSLSLVPYEGTREGDLYVIPRLDTPGKRIRYAFRSFNLPSYGWLYRQLLRRSAKDVEAIFTGEYTTVNKYQMRGYIPFEKKEEYKKIKKLPYERYHLAAIKIERYRKNLDYLYKIIDLCREHGAELIFVSMPVSEYSIAKYTNLQEIHDYYQEIADENSLAYVDFNLWKDKTDFEYLSDKYYQNPTHMGNKAAPVFSEQFSLIMKEYFAGMDVSGCFYEDFDTLCRDRGYVNEANLGLEPKLE